MELLKPSPLSKVKEIPCFLRSDKTARCIYSAQFLVKRETDDVSRTDEVKDSRGYSIEDLRVSWTIIPFARRTKNQQNSYRFLSNMFVVILYINIGDRFGRAVAISGNQVVVGADAESSRTTGIKNRDDHASADNGNNDSGAIYIFKR